jgi:muramoyltetrapeptide carboxypeptidase
MSKISLLTIALCAVFFYGNMILPAQNLTLNKTNTLIRPPYLKAGDTVAIVAPSGVLINRTSEITQAQNLLESWGLNAVVGKNVFNQAYHFAGSDEERREDFQNAMDDPKISAIWCARGGYGAVRILDKLDYTNFKKYPKWIIGYSDITALHNQVNIKGFESIHAMMCTSLQDDNETIRETISTFKDAVFGNPLAYTLTGSENNRTGSASGQLVGGNLTILLTMLGSETSINTSGNILFIEEIGEYEYHIDRMLQSLKRAGYFDNCKGVIVGDITKVRKNTTPWGVSVEQLIVDALSEYNFPIAFNMPAGHEKDNRAMIFGRTVQLKVDKNQSTIVFEK